MVPTSISKRFYEKCKALNVPLNATQPHWYSPSPKDWMPAVEGADPIRQLEQAEINRPCHGHYIIHPDHRDAAALVETVSTVSWQLSVPRLDRSILQHSEPHESNGHRSRHQAPYHASPEAVSSYRKDAQPE